MTATEELRRMLDERGVEWETTGWPAECQTFYEAGGVGYIAIGLDDELGDSRMRVCLEEYMTPAQVIEATLGRGTCCDTEGSGRDFCCSECGARLYIDTGDTYTMIAADEHTIIKHPNFCPNCGREVVA